MSDKITFSDRTLDLAAHLSLGAHFSEAAPRLDEMAKSRLLSAEDAATIKKFKDFLDKTVQAASTKVELDI